MSEVLSATQPPPQTCKKCNLSIFEGHAYELGEDRWHIGCFKCFKCEKLLGCNSNFLVLGNGSLVCSSCLYSCKQCGKKIDDLAILTGDQAYCSNCFKCRVCKVKIEDLRYARTSKGLFCMSCHEDLIAKKRKHDLKRKQLALLMLLLRPAPTDDLKHLVMASSALSRLSAVSSSPHTNPNDIYLHHDPSLSSILNKQLPPNPDSRSSPASPSATDPIAHTAPSAVSLSTTEESTGHAAEPSTQALASGQNTLLGLAFTNDPSVLFPNSSNDIEEVCDLDDELHLRKVRENLERRFLKHSNGSSGAILELIDSFSAPNTPSTIYNNPGSNTSPASTHHALDDQLKNDAASFSSRETPVLRQEISKSLGWANEQSSPHKNILLRSPNQFHDNDFHNADNIHDDGIPVSLSIEESRRQHFGIASPMARVNRQARVVETNDKNSPTDLGLETRSPGHRITNEGLSTPQKPLPPKSSPLLSSPPPRLALPVVPLTPQQNESEVLQRIDRLGDLREPKGLGLEGFDLQKAHAFQSATPNVVNLEDAQGEHPQNDDFQKSPPSRKPSVKNLLLSRHKRSTSNSLGGGLSSKLGIFKSKDEPDSLKGHTRHVLEGSINGQAFTTPPLPFTSPMVQVARRNSHTRSTSDTNFMLNLENDPQKRDFEMRAIKFEIYQLDSRRQALLAENMKLNSDKSKLLDALSTLLKRVTLDTQAKEVLSLEVKDLAAQKKKLKEDTEELRSEHRSLQEAVWRTREQFREMNENHASQGYDNPNETFESNNVLDSMNYEGTEAQKATRLKFWRRPKVTIANTHAQSQQNNGPNVVPSSGSIPHSLSSYKLSSTYTSNTSPAQSQSSTVDDSFGARKALNGLVAKARPATSVESFGNSSHGSSSNTNADAPLLSSTLLRRAAFENGKVPLIIIKCIEEVEKRGLDTEGIYRLSGGNSAISAIESAFAGIPANGAQEKKQITKLNDVLGGDINAVTSALKRYLRKLPDPLIPFAFYSTFVWIGQRKVEKTELCNEFKSRIISKLPSANKHALYLIVKHLNEVHRYSNVNRMTFKNLSVVFAPTIARDATGEREMVDMGPRNEATELLFSNFSTLFANFSQDT